MNCRTVRIHALLMALLVLAGLAGCAAPTPGATGSAGPAFTRAPQGTAAPAESPATPDSERPSLPDDSGQPQRTPPATPGGNDPQGTPPTGSGSPAPPGNGGQQLPVATVSGQPLDFGTADLTGTQAGLLEKLLANWGFACYPPDGSWQDDNAYELSLFQRWAGLTPDGQLTDDTREALRTTYAVWADGRVDRMPLALEGRSIAIDAAGQATVRYEAEPISPERGSPVKLTTYHRVQGAESGAWDYQRNLELALALAEKLKALGARVTLTRTDNDADIAAVLRAKRINVENPDAAVLLRCGDEAGCAAVQPAERGYQTGALLAESRKLSRCLQAGLAYDGTLESRTLGTDDAIPGLNWSKVPVTLVEPGSLADPDDDGRLADEGYRAALVAALADGLGDYFATMAAG